MRTLVRGPRGPGGALATTNRRTNALCLKGHVEDTHSAVEVVAGALAVELPRAEVDVRGAVAVHPALRLGAVGAGVASVEVDSAHNVRKDGEHFGDGDFD
eukprot:CAMPEP_0180232394 /NCGR_PEP_ID=MMETSP0987-20121128/27444_1 /TAXON_ID=697907 /ORGANISM="non described non described, Strain CCMP2293" /LENGTH=99 /DNA_ID=CAMNT_0022197993 /DNA_START=538 /DNA_END=835 /DNA_ORIENTATION=-